MDKIPEKTDGDKEAPKGRKICAWCKKDLGSAESKMDTHGVCQECSDKILEDDKEPEK